LERLAETGPLGLLALLALYAALGAAALRRARRARDENRPGDAAQVAAGAGAVAAFAGCGLTGFPFAMPGTVFLLGVAIGLLAVDAVDGRTPARSAPAAPAARVAAALVAVLLLAGGSWWSARRIAAAYWLARADAALHRGPGVAEAETALPFLARAARAAPRDFQVALRASAAELRAGHPPAASDEARRALDLEPDSANAWEALARARLATGDARGAAEAADRALAILHTYPGALYTRAQASTRLGDDARAEAARARLTALAATDADARRLLDTLPRAAPSACSSRFVVSTRARRSSPSATTRAPSRPSSPPATCAPPSSTGWRAGCRSAAPGSACCCRCFRGRSNRCRSAGSTWSSPAATPSPRAPSRPRARCTSPTCTRRCATSGRRRTTTPPRSPAGCSGERRSPRSPAGCGGGTWPRRRASRPWWRTASTPGRASGAFTIATPR